MPTDALRNMPTEIQTGILAHCKGIRSNKIMPAAKVIPLGMHAQFRKKSCNIVA
jgi:hypothetical protein